jgi:hypothetical protein
VVKNIVAGNTRATIEELLELQVFVLCMSYQRTVGYWFFAELLFVTVVFHAEEASVGAVL